MSESCEQQKMVLVDTEKYIRDGVEYTVTYQASGLATCESEAPKVPEPGSPNWVSYKMTFSVAKPNEGHILKFRQIKVSPHSAAGKALVKKS